MLEARFLSLFRQQFPELVGQRLLVAASGGGDSIALLLLLVRTRHELKLDLGVCHVHHGVRGAEADEDARFCQQLAERLGLPFFLDRLSLPPPGPSREAWWREQRYAALEARRRQFHAAAIATAHTLDDQAETVLLKLLRGAGPRGVAGIRRRWRAVIRPLLDFRREELRQYLHQLGQDFRQDSSNLLSDRPRTFLRWKVLPLLVQAFPKAFAHLAFFAETLAQDDDFLSQLTLSAVPVPRLGERVPVASVVALARPLRFRWLQSLGASLSLPEPPSRRQFDLFCAMLERGEPRGLDLGLRWVLVRRGESLTLQPPPLAPFSPVAVSVPGVFLLPGGFRLGLGEPLARADHRACLDPRIATASLRVRPLPAGLCWEGCHVREELARLGVPAAWRRAWPVLEADGTIAWVPGVGVSPAWAQPSGVLAELEEPWERQGKSSHRKPLPSA